MLFGTFKNPKGPSWEDPETTVLHLSGTVVEFSLPRSNYTAPSYAMGGTIERSKEDYSIDISKYKPTKINNCAKNELIYDVQLKRIFNFNGLPLLGTSMGALNFTLSICSNACNEFRNNFFDCFFQRLEKLHGKKETDGYLYRLYPINWSLIDINEVSFLNYGVEDFLFHPKGISTFRMEFVCPINSNTALDFKFHFDGIPLKSGGIKLAHELIKKIMQTCKVIYTPEHKQQVDALDLKEKFKPIKPVIWENYKKAPRVDYSILEKYL
ncbi:hypothetical protein [Marinibactrum halimedae]|uniref:Uncharacterized protein n=1 Tax=Marinibactrum halimedae TaxID=1444977 RepID=A0AA37T866_9GAMM|nr:hypothetical protein [Marinibactrum halimedae]MCD9460390.1 hypothetical protein [Marinibactrum halimedae]GLS27481.1 hypothetical protein GCM10007877_32000 [Marinibactrum halimedae]